MAPAVFPKKSHYTVKLVSTASGEAADNGIEDLKKKKKTTPFFECQAIWNVPAFVAPNKCQLTCCSSDGRHLVYWKEILIGNGRESAIYWLFDFWVSLSSLKLGKCV